MSFNETQKWEQHSSSSSSSLTVLWHNIYVTSRVLLYLLRALYKFWIFIIGLNHRMYLGVDDTTVLLMIQQFLVWFTLQSQVIFSCGRIRSSADIFKTLVVCYSVSVFYRVSCSCFGLIMKVFNKGQKWNMHTFWKLNTIFKIRFQFSVTGFPKTYKKQACFVEMRHLSNILHRFWDPCKIV